MNFSKRSFHFAIISLILMTIFLLLSLVSRDGSTTLDSIIGYMITLFFVTVVIGFVFALLSLREKASTKKYIGLAVNVILLILLAVNTFQNLSTVSQAFS